MLSLDATVVLLTPVVIAIAGRMRIPARPHAYAAGHLANSASLLLPVSNLTNLLAFAATGLSFLHFTGLMARARGWWRWPSSSSCSAGCSGRDLAGPSASR